jgi:hypothetical protein
MHDGEGRRAKSEGVSVRRRVAIGCFTTWLGFCSGAMVAALVARMVAFLTRASACSGIPSCNWYIYALVGGGIGAVTLPLLVLRTLGKPAKGSNPDRGC